MITRPQRIATILLAIAVAAGATSIAAAQTQKHEEAIYNQLRQLDFNPADFPDEIELTERDFTSYLAMMEDRSYVAGAAVPGQPTLFDAALLALAKKHGFASADRFKAVVHTCSSLMFWVDPKTGKLKEEMVANQARISESMKRDQMSLAGLPPDLQEKMAAMMRFNQRLMTPPKYPGNIALYNKYRAKMDAAMAHAFADLKKLAPPTPPKK